MLFLLPLKESLDSKVAAGRLHRVRAQNRQTGSFSSDASRVSCVFSEEGLFR